MYFTNSFQENLEIKLELSFQKAVDTLKLEKILKKIRK